MKIEKMLAQCRREIVVSQSVRGSLGCISFLGASALLLFLVDNLLHLPAGMRLPLAIGFLAAFFSGLVKKVFSPFFHHRNLERTALFLEGRCSIEPNLLINALEFSRTPHSGPEKRFAGLTISEAESAISRETHRLWEMNRNRRWAVWAFLVLSLWATYASVFPRYLTNAWKRYLSPLKDVPPAGSVVLNLSPFQNIEITEGDSLEVLLQVEGMSFEKGDLPVLVWHEGFDYIEPDVSSGHSVPMSPGSSKDSFFYRFQAIRSSFAFRVLAADTYTPSIRVTILPFPKIKSAFFDVTGPAYVGSPKDSFPGPPFPLIALTGSEAIVTIETDRPVLAMSWKTEENRVPFAGSGKWIFSFQVERSGPYEIEAVFGNGKKFILASGDISARVDQAPEVSFLSPERNRTVSPGSVFLLQVQGSDDFGIARVQVTCTCVLSKQSRVLKSWEYAGPPGEKGPMKENLEIALAPEKFTPGNSYLLEALCDDFCEQSPTGKSSPLLLRVQSPSDLSVSDQNDMSKAFALLQQTISEQRTANGACENFRVYLLEALQKETVQSNQESLSKKQSQARAKGFEAMAEFKKSEEGLSYARRLEPIVKGEMLWVLESISKIREQKAAGIPVLLQEIEKRQAYILARLIEMLGRIAQAEKKEDEKKGGKPPENLPEVTSKEKLQELKEDLKEFVRAQQDLLERSKSLLHGNLQDLTQEEEKILGELAREEARLSDFLEEKLTDFSKLPQQDFSDGSLADEFNEVYQEIKLAEKFLYEKKIEMAVPHEQSGLEKAESLVHNLEKWLPDMPDNKKWSMEEPKADVDIPLAELPAELEDIVGELIDQESEMDEEVEDVSSSWMDSLDKGAGWGVSDGPISNMSARGVTGNLLPNKNEIGGRSGEGRSGQSHGQMVEKTAEGKGGRETPTRLTPGPFESGSVEDKDKSNKGGSTGGGKLSGFSEEGLRGPTPPPVLEKMARLAGQQVKVRQKAETVATRLKKYRLPSGDMDAAIGSMKKLEESAQKGDGVGIRRSFHQAMDALKTSRKNIRLETGVRRESIHLPQEARQEIMSGFREYLPKGYEEMVGRYFRALAEQANER